MNAVKILVCYHKPSCLWKDEILTPIHVGRALARERMGGDSPEYRWLEENMIGDDTGDNISAKNQSYNEMTAIYWAWKNYDKLGNPDYIGLMHYRRHFVLRPGEIDVIHFEDMDGSTYLDEINYSPEKMQALVEGCDIIAHIGKVKNVYRHYLENHKKEDLDRAFDILYEFHPEYRETAREYLEGDLSNFCNMFIFSRELFFQYCEWIFPILEEFEKRVDIAGKRLFISERLTGVFIAGLMKNKSLNHKVVPISMVTGDTVVQLAIPYEEESGFLIAVTILSLLKNKHSNSQYSVSLLCRPDGNQEEKARIKELFTAYKSCRIRFVETEASMEDYPFLLPELLPEVDKCVYMTKNAIVLGDLSEFYRTCSTDDYCAVGVPLEEYDVYRADKKVRMDFLVMDLKKLRRTEAFKNRAGGRGKDAVQLFNEICQGNVGYVPWYFITITDKISDEHSLFGGEQTRRQLREAAAWKPVLFYGTEKPWEDFQDVYSIFWWEITPYVPIGFRFPRIDLDAVGKLSVFRQQEINEIGTMLQDQAEDWRSYSVWGKLMFYYRHNGFAATVRYCCKKYVLRGR